MEGQGRLVAPVAKNFVDGEAVGLSEDIPVLGLGIELGGSLLKSNGFDGSLLLESESFAFVVRFAIFCEWHLGPGLVVKADFFSIFVSLGANAPRRLLLGLPHLHFQVAYHLNDHYYNSKPTSP
jgi:hypothetical protein